MAHEFSRVREKLGSSDGKLEKDAEGRGRSRRGDGGIYSRQESSEACAPAPCLIRQPLNPGGHCD